LIGSNDDYIFDEFGLATPLDPSSIGIWDDAATSVQTRPIIRVVPNTKGVFGFTTSELNSSGQLPVDPSGTTQFASYWEIKGAALQLTRPLSKKTQLVEGVRSNVSRDKFVSFRFEIGDDENLCIHRISVDENGATIRTLVHTF
jgi:hypothetical protein